MRLILLIESPAVFPILMGVVRAEDGRGEPGCGAEAHCCVGDLLLDRAVLLVRDIGEVGGAALEVVDCAGRCRMREGGESEGHGPR